MGISEMQQVCESRQSKWNFVVLLLAVLTVTGACSLKSMAINMIASFTPTFANPAVYLSEEDPEIVREALPFLLKTIESVLETAPEQPDALLSACLGFTLYANAFIQTDAILAEWEDYKIAEELKGRALKMYIRARDYCLRRAELSHPGIGEQLQKDPESAVVLFHADDVETMYYLGGSWALAISLGLDQPALAADLPAVKALIEHASMLDEDYNRGALHTALIMVESVPEEMGGSEERARKRFVRAVELSDGLDASPYLSLATGVAIPRNDRDEFQELLEKALAIDPDADTSIRLLNIISQKQALSLLDHIDDIFGPPLDDEQERFQ